jgi:hypothetical protein
MGQEGSMSKVENIEQEIRDLTPLNLPLSAGGFLNLTLKRGTAKLKRILERANWTSLQTKLWPHLALEGVRSFETFCRAELLELLSNPSEIGPRTCG